MNLLTFLGAGKYSETTYTFPDGRQHPTRYAPAATAHFYRPKKTLVVVTELAEKKHFEALADEIADVTQPVAIPIPDGKSEDELWQIFNALTEHVSEGDELMVDITYGFRSLPFLNFLAVAFLRLARRVKVERILYGAWDARNEANESPVFDLTPFLSLLDWTIATDRFTRFGDASDLAILLKQGIPIGSALATSPDARQLRDALKSPAEAMEAVSLAMRLTRPLETMTAAAQLTEKLQHISPLVEQNAPPFAILTEKIWRAYDQFSLEDTLAQKNYPANLKIQLDMIDRYLEQEQVVQAMTLAREWLISLLVIHLKAGLLTDHKGTREPIEHAISNMAARLKKKEPRYNSPFDEPLQSLPVAEELGKLWDELTQIRNDIAHVGMNPHLKSAEKLRKYAQSIYPRLKIIWAYFYPERTQ